jgi:hypothetical protein
MVLAPNTTYFVYVYMAASVMTMDFSLTGCEFSKHHSHGHSREFESWFFCTAVNRD